MKTLLIGTGYLGRTVVERLRRESIPVIHTYNSRQTFPDSIHFNLLTQSLSDVVQLESVDAVIFTSNIEKLPDSDAILTAMKHAFTACKDKRVVYTSSDAVFDGKKGQYTESDVANPVTDYGRHKVFIEELLPTVVDNYCIVRPSYIYGHSLARLDRRLREAIELAQSGQPIPRFTDMYKSPTEVNFLADALIKIAQSEIQGILHVAGPRVSVYDFFKQALGALSEDAALVMPDTMLNDAPQEMLVDTSLSSSRLADVLGIVHPSIAKSLLQTE